MLILKSFVVLFSLINLTLLIYCHNRYNQIPFNRGGRWMKRSDAWYEFFFISILLSSLILISLLGGDLFEILVLKTPDSERFLYSIKSYWGEENFKIATAGICVPTFLGTAYSSDVFLRWFFRVTLIEGIARVIEKFRK